MKKEYKELFDNIKPDSELMYDTFNKADENKKSTVFMPRKIVAAALVMAVLAVGSGFGIHQIKEPKAIEDIENTTHTMDDLPSSDFFTITAFASDDENAEIKTLSPNNITLIDYKIELKKENDIYGGIDNQTEEWKSKNNNNCISKENIYNKKDLFKRIFKRKKK